MLINIFDFLIGIITNIIASFCLLRFYMQTQKISFNNPVGNLIFALSDWLIMPIRKLIPFSKFRYDSSCLIGAFLVRLIYLIFFFLFNKLFNWNILLIILIFDLIKLSIQGLIVIIIIYAVLSWFSPYNPIAYVLRQLSQPVLGKFKKIIPPVKGIDLTPLIAIISLQVLIIICQYLMTSLIS